MREANLLNFNNILSRCQCTIKNGFYFMHNWKLISYQDLIMLQGGIIILQFFIKINFLMTFKIIKRFSAVFTLVKCLTRSRTKLANEPCIH